MQVTEEDASTDSASWNDFETKFEKVVKQALAQSKGQPDPYAQETEGETTGFTSETAATLDGGTDIDTPSPSPPPTQPSTPSAVKVERKPVESVDSAGDIPLSMSHPSMIVVPHEPLPPSTIATAEVDPVEGVKRAIIIID